MNIIIPPVNNYWVTSLSDPEPMTRWWFKAEEFVINVMNVTNVINSVEMQRWRKGEVTGWLWAHRRLCFPGECEWLSVEDFSTMHTETVKSKFGLYLWLVESGGIGTSSNRNAKDSFFYEEARLCWGWAQRLPLHYWVEIPLCSDEFVEDPLSHV